MTTQHQQSKQEPWDAQWFSQLLDIKAPRFVGKSYRDAKKQFYRTISIEPSYDYSFQKNFDLSVPRHAFDRLLTAVTNDRSTPPEVRSLYRAKLAEIDALLTLYAYSYDLIFSGLDRTTEIQALVESVFGRPQADIFNHLRSKLKALYVELPFPQIRSRHYHNLQSLFEDVPESTVADLTPIAGTSTLTNHVYTTSSDVQERLQSVLSENNLTEWEVIISKRPVGGFQVKPRKKRIIVPSSKILRARKGERLLTEERLQAIIQHEVLTHAVRANNGLRSRLQLLGVGLAGYLRGEEGLASYREQQIVGATDYHNQAMYLALGIAYGLDRGGKKRTFFETFKLLHDYNYAFLGLSGQYSKLRAFASCHRIYRATTGGGTGYIITKDVAYREGNIAIHGLMQKIGGEQSWLNVGKFDPTNNEHMQALKKLGLIPEAVG